MQALLQKQGVEKTKEGDQDALEVLRSEEDIKRVVGLEGVSGKTVSL